MEGTGTGATAMLVGTPEDVGGRPDAATVTVTREEIEEALASKDPLDLILSVKSGETDPQDVRVAWERSDLEKVLAGIDSGAVTFSFDRAELQRALEQPDFEGHGIREMVLLTVAAASASAALATSTASGQLMDGSGVEGGTPAAAVQPGDPGTIPYLSHGIGVDESVFQGEATAAAQPGDPGTIPYLSHGIGVDESVFQGEATAAAQPGDPGTIPYLSHGIGVDESVFQGEASPSGDVATPAIHDEATPAQRGVGQTVPGADEATLADRGVDVAIATAIGAHDEATTARDLAPPTANDEATAAARGVGQTVPGADEAGLAARGVEANVTAPIGTGDATTARDLATPAAADSGTSFELPSVDTGTAAAIGALAGAGLIIVGAAFVARRRVTPV
jgi:hypothetical protein